VKENVTLVELKSTPLFVTSSTREPTFDGGVVHKTSVADTYVALAVTRPKRHLRFEEQTKPLPKTLTTVPPASEPDVGMAEVTTASSTKEYFTSFVV
jgi:hypothetical protein